MKLQGTGPFGPVDNPPKVCKKCGSVCELKFNNGSPAWVCTKDDCRHISEYER